MDRAKPILDSEVRRADRRMSLSGDTYRQWIGGGPAKPVIDALMRGLAHVIFSFGRCHESTVGGHRVESGAKINIYFPPHESLEWAPFISYQRRKDFADGRNL